jgi:hypothetical protein
VRLSPALQWPGNRTVRRRFSSFRFDYISRESRPLETLETLEILAPHLLDLLINRGPRPRKRLDRLVPNDQGVLTTLAPHEPGSLSSKVLHAHAESWCSKILEANVPGEPSTLMPGNHGVFGYRAPIVPGFHLNHGTCNTKVSSCLILLERKAPNFQYALVASGSRQPRLQWSLETLATWQLGNVVSRVQGTRATLET